MGKLWKDIDTNGDGVLSSDEISLACGHGQLTPRVLRTMDIDNDGEISVKEIEVARSKARLSTANKYKLTPLQDAEEMLQSEDGLRLEEDSRGECVKNMHL